MVVVQKMGHYRHWTHQGPHLQSHFQPISNNTNHNTSHITDTGINGSTRGVGNEDSCVYL